MTQTYMSLVKATDRNVQNIQELASIWGEIRTEVEAFDASLVDSYAVLGDYDFVVIFDAADSDTAFKAALTMERHGLDAQTMEVVSTDHFANLVEDV